MQGVAIVLLCILAAATYGAVSHVALGHLPLLSSEPATLSGVGRGLLASWWVGLLLGVSLAFSARVGHRPKRDVRSLVRPIVGVLLVTYTSAFFASTAGFVLGDHAMAFLPDRLASRVPPDRSAFFLADLAGSAVGYIVGFVGGVVLIVWVWRSRERPMGHPRTHG
ncbi:hypothetical protein AB1L88_16505 [Tautonia sp. JC769]|uniref:hypothetical protein n=1 Tax=Tautonia sp. JC769 TaxID=3232135 RepID=UPI003457BF89